jgi:nucleoside-diphosphate-sugar epimerase
MSVLDTDSSPKRLLASGVEGFTGRYLREEFASNGWEVHGFGTKVRDLAGYHRADLQDLDALRQLVLEVKPDAVVHLAGIAFPAHHTAIDFYNAHITGTFNLLKALSEHGSGIKKVLLASTANVYGANRDGVCHESAPLKPFNDYGVSKLAMEYMAWLWREKLPIVIARPFNYTGVGQAAHFLLPKIVSHYAAGKKEIQLGNLHVARDYSDVRDVVKAYCLLVDCPESKGAVNVCSGHAVTVAQILEIMNRVAGYDIQVTVNPEFVRKGEIELLVGSRERLEGLVGLCPWRSLEETLNWMFKSSVEAGE